MENLKRSVCAGIMIGFGAVVYLQCENKIVGALLFTIGLFAICSFGMNLFTGKIGYVFSNKNDPDCLVIWAGNLIGASASMALIRLAKPDLHLTARALVSAKLEQGYFSAAITGFFCGILMYLAVENYRANPHGAGKITGLFLSVSVFILSGFEHSVADMCYLALAVENIADLPQYLLFLLTVSVSNAIGAVATRYMTFNKNEKK